MSLGSSMETFFPETFQETLVGQVYELSASEENWGDDDWLRETQWAPWRRVDYMNKTGVLSPRSEGRRVGPTTGNVATHF